MVNYIVLLQRYMRLPPTSSYVYEPDQLTAVESWEVECTNIDGYRLMYLSLSDVVNATPDGRKLQSTVIDELLFNYVEGVSPKVLIAGFSPDKDCSVVWVKYYACFLIDLWNDLVKNFSLKHFMINVSTSLYNTMTVRIKLEPNFTRRHLAASHAIDPLHLHSARDVAGLLRCVRRDLISALTHAFEEIR